MAVPYRRRQGSTTCRGRQGFRPNMVAGRQMDCVYRETKGRSGTAGVLHRTGRWRGQQADQCATGASALRWFPDSKRIAFVSWVWPDQDRQGAGEVARNAKIPRSRRMSSNARTIGSGIIGSPTEESRMCLRPTSGKVARAIFSPGPGSRSNRGSPRRESTISVRTASNSQ